MKIEGFGEIGVDSGMNQLERLQIAELDILDEFVRVCEELGINYFFECGSVLGAVRHQGFIPWDDDIDVGMMRNDYNIFIKRAPEFLREKYYLESETTIENYERLFSKLRNKYTIFDEGQKNVECKGIFIDIFPHDYLPDDEGLRRKIIKHAQKLRWLDIIQLTKKRVVAPGRDLKWKIGELCLRIVHPILNFFPKNFFKKKMSEYVQKWNVSESHWVTCHYDADPFVMHKDDFFPLIKVPFCGKEYYIMKDYKQYLTQEYGNYMQLPPEDKRITHLPKQIIFEDEYFQRIENLEVEQ